MPFKHPRFWLEILILGFMLVFGIATLQEWLPQPWAYLSRFAYAAALFGTYALYYERQWKKQE